MGDVAEHIAGWETAGLIDAATADRLRATLSPEGATDGTARRGHSSQTFGNIFGPGVHVAEAFTYLGIGFLASAWTVFLASIAIGGDDARTAWILGSGASALVFAGIVAFLRRGDARWRRGAGVASLVSTSFAASASWFTADVVVRGDDPLTFVLAALGAAAVAVAFRVVLPALLTQFGVLVTATTLAAAILNFARISIFGEPTFDTPAPGNEAILLLALEAAWWIVIGIAFGVLGLQEADAVGDTPAQHRASLTRLWAGLVVVGGVASAVTRSGPLPGSEFEYGRLLEPWVGDVILIVVALILVERAFRRGSGAFLAGGAIALIIALSDFNASYLTDSIQTGLLVEGVILLAIGFGANRLRHLLDRPGEDAVVPEVTATG